MDFRTASFRAIGVTNQITVTDPLALAGALRIARAELAALDLACSRFRDDSEIAALNVVRERCVSALLFEAVAVALGAAEATAGLVDPTVGAAMRGLGYDREYDVVVAAGPRPSFRLVPATGWRSVRLDRTRRRITLLANRQCRRRVVRRRECGCDRLDRPRGACSEVAGVARPRRASGLSRRLDRDDLRLALGRHRNVISAPRVALRRCTAAPHGAPTRARFPERRTDPGMESR
jgi:hypothetical protein